MDENPNNFPKGISERTRRIMNLALISAEESDEEIDSEDSYIPDEDDLLISSEEYSTDDDEDKNPISNTIPASGDDGSSNFDVESSISPQNHLIDNENPHEELDLQPPSVVGGTPNSALQSGCFYGKKKCFTWSESPVCSGNGRETNRNIIRIRCSSLEGPARQLGNAPKPKEVWDLLFSPDMKTEIVEHTNKKLSAMRIKIRNTDSTMYKDVDDEELDALFAIILFCSIFKSSKERLASLFSTSVIGRPLFRGIMTEKRCCILLRALRFDNSASRPARLENDRAACISNIFNKFIKNSQRNYSIGTHCTVDETLVPFRGRVSFKMHMPMKPAKYGIKEVCLTDSHNAYLYDAYIYKGRGSDGGTLTPEEKKLSVPTQSVIRLTKAIQGTNRNITCDNWFTSVQLAEELWKRNLTLVGTMKKNKPQIPSEFQPSTQRAVGSSIYGFTKEISLVSHVSKKNKAVVLLSTMHHSPYTDPRTEKPEIISFYNVTKCGVDSLDQKCSVYSVNRRTRRWPLAVFYHMMAACSSNSFCLYQLFPGAEAKSRFAFVNDLALGLANRHVTRRLQIPNLPAPLKKTIREIAGVDEEPIAGEERSNQLEKRKLCRFCPYQKNRATKVKCAICDIPTCGEHSKKVCLPCVSKM